MQVRVLPGLFGVVVNLNGERTDVGGTSDADEHLTGASVRLGRRFYQAPRGKVVSFQSLALEGQFLDRALDLPGGAGQLVAEQWRAGLFGELGAAYLVTSSLSLGGSASIAGGYLRRWFRRRRP